MNGDRILRSDGTLFQTAGAAARRDLSLRCGRQGRHEPQNSITPEEVSPKVKLPS